MPGDVVGVHLEVQAFYDWEGYDRSGGILDLHLSGFDAGRCLGGYFDHAVFAGTFQRYDDLGSGTEFVQDFFEGFDGRFVLGQHGHEGSFHADMFGKSCDTEDSKEGTQAFLEKRRADFQGK